jgi:hypothetical protein
MERLRLGRRYNGEETYRSDSASSRDSADGAGRLADSSAEHY